MNICVTTSGIRKSITARERSPENTSGFSNDTELPMTRHMCWIETAHPGGPSICYPADGPPSRVALPIGAVLRTGDTPSRTKSRLEQRTIPDHHWDRPRSGGLRQNESPAREGGVNDTNKPQTKPRPKGGVVDRHQGRIAAAFINATTIAAAAWSSGAGAIRRAPARPRAQWHRRGFRGLPKRQGSPVSPAAGSALPGCCA
jgi:hypothetical protein